MPDHGPGACTPHGRIEAELPAHWRAVLDDLADVLPLDRDSFDGWPSLRVVVETYAVARVARRLREEDARLAYWDSYRRAAIRLGLNPSTVVSRIQTVSKTYRRAA